MRRDACLLLVVAMISTAAQAARPLTVDDAAPVGKGQFQLMTGVLYKSDSSMALWDTPSTLGFGLIDKLEVGIGFGCQCLWTHESSDGDSTDFGADDLFPYAKWQLLTQEKAGVDLTLLPSVKIPIADHDEGLGSGKVDYNLLLIATRQLNDVLAMDFNIGYSWIGRTGDDDDPSTDVLFYGTALRYQMTETFQLVGEIYGLDAVSDGHTQGIVNAGVRWQFAKSLALDAALGTGLGGDAPDVIATTGLTWNF